MGWSLFTYLFLIWFQLFLTLFLKHCMEVWFWGRECIIPHTVLSHYFISKFSIVLFIRVNTQTCCWVYTHALVRGTISIWIFFFFKCSNKTKTILQTVYLSLDIESKTKLTFDMWLLQNWSYNQNLAFDYQHLLCFVDWFCDKVWDWAGITFTYKRHDIRLLILRLQESIRITWIIEIGLRQSHHPLHLSQNRKWSQHVMMAFWWF